MVRPASHGPSRVRQVGTRPLRRTYRRSPTDTGGDRAGRSKGWAELARTTFRREVAMAAGKGSQEELFSWLEEARLIVCPRGPALGETRARELVRDGQCHLITFNATVE